MRYSPCLFSILFSVGLVRILGQAAGGRVDNQAVFELVGADGRSLWLPVMLTLTLFMSVLMALTRAYRDSEMVVWFAAGRSLTAWIGTGASLCLADRRIESRLLSMFVTPWSNSADRGYAPDALSKRDDVSRVAPGRFIESGGADRVFFVESVNFSMARCATSSSACAARAAKVSSSRPRA